MKNLTAIIFLFTLLVSCSENDSFPENPKAPEEPLAKIYRLPIVVHVIHKGESIGTGGNLSDERILRQIEILNEDFRRKEGTRGFNDHPEGDDAKIEFVLADKDPNGDDTTGIVREQFRPEEIPDEVPNFEFERFAHFSYWPSEDYINVWVAPYGEFTNILLGMSTGPFSDLPGSDLFQEPLPGGAEGIIVNWAHFGESDVDGGHNLGRTLTHEMGHYLGLLHTWGANDCEANDYCDDTPAVDKKVSASEPYLGCAGEDVMVANYMNYSPDHIMNIFTKEQIARMHHVIKNSPRRTSLLTSKGLTQ
ncbi:M43 family zinc metalloprotease [Flagellimonas crocea]|uniref:M43 family zinc metalloprotease n=1 Tax=Flagellimonas crocea TaxID=3067311 RepID=UPI00296F3764|nr:M43 family zinc metalloprotease [Muricauda sp. DH64]